MSDGEPGKIAAVVSRLETLYEAADPRLGCTLVEAIALLVLADVRGTTNVVLFEPTDADRAVMGHLENTLEGLGLRAWMSEETRNANGRMCCAVVPDSLEGHGFVSTQSQMP